MTSLVKMLRDEITRLARKEARKQVGTIRAASASHRRQIAELKRTVALLRRQLAALSRAGKTVAGPSTASTTTRFVAKGLRTLRTRLGLSAAEFGKLAGASGQSIYNWERGKAVPRKEQRATLIGLRALGKREARARLSQITPKAAKNTRKSSKRR